MKVSYWLDSFEEKSHIGWTHLKRFTV